MSGNLRSKFQGENSFSESLEEFVECSLCFHPFDEDDLKPKFLSCFHSFCLKCLQALCAHSKIICPMCRAVTQVAKGPANLATNSYAICLIRVTNSTDLAIWVSKCEEKEAQILSLQQLNQSLEIKNQELVEKLRELHPKSLNSSLDDAGHPLLLPKSSPGSSVKTAEVNAFSAGTAAAKVNENTPASTQSDDIDTFIRHFRSQLRGMGLVYKDVVTWGANEHPGLTIRVISSFMTKKISEQRIRDWMPIFRNFLIDMSVEQPVIRISSSAKKANPIFPKRIRDVLEHFYNQNSRPPLRYMVEIARELRISTQSVDAWFSKRRLTGSTSAQ